MTARPLIYRTKTGLHVPDLPVGVSFRLNESVRNAMGIARAYLSIYGPRATVKMLAKLMAPGRAYYAALENGRIVSDGWITRGRCKYYVVGPRDCVIGPIWTAPAWRGRGLAHATLVRATHACLASGAHWVYIDTTADNIASQKTIEKSGFVPVPG